MEAKLKHLDMLQAIINRMANNSFLLKGWAVVLVAALFALGAKDSRIEIIALAVYPVFLFWILDAWFLRQERLFRCVYDKVRLKAPADIDFDMSPAHHHCTPDPLIKVAGSITLSLFYFSLLLGILVVSVILPQ